MNATIVKRRKLVIGCTVERHRQIGIHAVVNARGGNQHLNDQSMEDIELMRDARNLEAWRTGRVRFYGFNSRFCRKHIGRLAHTLSTD